MKKTLIAMSVVGAIAGAAIAQEVVTSVNIVGYKKHTFEAGKIYLVSTQFESIDGSPVTPETAIGDQLPENSEIYAWNAFAQPPAYETSRRVFDFFENKTVWNGNLVLNGGRGFWLRPAGTPGTQYEVALMGEVPLRGAYTNVVAEGITMMAYPYTADIAFSNTALYATSQINDEMFVWDPDKGGTGGYDTYRKVFDFFNNVTNWNGGGETLIISQGTGLWYRQTSGNPVSVVDLRPYNP